MKRKINEYTDYATDADAAMLLAVESLTDTQVAMDFLLQELVGCPGTNIAISQIEKLKKPRFIPKMSTKSLPSSIHVPRAIMAHQLHVVLSNATQVAVELNDLQEKGVVRSMYATGAQSSVANGDQVLMYTSDYTTDVLASLSGQAGQRFVMHLQGVSGRCHSVLKSDLIRASGGDCSGDAGDTEGRGGARMTVADIDAIVSAGFLLPRRDTHSPEPLYWYSHPRLGPLSMALKSVRKRVVQCVRATRYREMKEKALRKKADDKRYTSLTMSLGFKFHMADILGMGELVASKLPDGSTLLRLPPKT